MADLFWSMFHWIHALGWRWSRTSWPKEEKSYSALYNHEGENRKDREKRPRNVSFQSISSMTYFLQLGSTSYSCQHLHIVHPIINPSMDWSIMSSELSWSNHFPKIPLLNIATLKIKPSTREPLWNIPYSNHNEG